MSGAAFGLVAVGVLAGLAYGLADLGVRAYGCWIGRRTT